MLKKEPIQKTAWADSTFISSENRTLQKDQKVII